MAAKKIRKRSYAFKLEQLPHFPTKERVAKGDIKIRGKSSYSEDPIRIDKLYKSGIIDEMQHLYGLQIITYWTIANRPFIRTGSYEQRIGKGYAPMEQIAISRMSAEDKFYKTMQFLDECERALISKICFEEKAAIEAGRDLGLPVNSITDCVRAAFDALGDALTKMRDFKKEIEKPKEDNLADVLL